MDRGKSSMNALAQFPCGLCNPPLQGLQGTAVARCASHSAKTSERLNTLQKPETPTRNRMVSPDHCKESLPLLDSWEQSCAHPTLAPFSRQLLTRIQESAFTAVGISSQKNPKSNPKNQPTLTKTP